MLLDQDVFNEWKPDQDKWLGQSACGGLGTFLLRLPNGLCEEPAAPVSARDNYETHPAARCMRKVRLPALSVVRGASTAPCGSPPSPAPLRPHHLLWAPLPSPSPNCRAKDPDETARQRQAATAQAQCWEAGEGACWPRLPARVSQSDSAGGRCVRLEQGTARSLRLAGGVARRRRPRAPWGEVGPGRPAGVPPRSPRAGSGFPARGWSPALPGCPLARSSRDKIIGSASVVYVELPFGILPVPARSSVLSAGVGGNGRCFRVAVLFPLCNFKGCQCALLGEGENNEERKHGEWVRVSPWCVAEFCTESLKGELLIKRTCQGWAVN